MPRQDNDVYNFVTFMRNHIRKKDSKEIITHTLMGPLHKDIANYKGSYNIEGVDYEIFMNLYQVALEKMPMHIVERPKEVGPMVIDIDFKTHKKHRERQYLDSHIEEVIKVYNDLFKKYLEIDDRQIKAFVFEKPDPTYVEKDKQWKDGFHILYPEIPINVKKRYFFFDKAKEIIINKDIFEEIPFVNTYDDILDSSVIKNNGMLMYGSSKEGRDPYYLTKIYEHDLSIEKTEMFDQDDLPNYLSIRRYCDEDDIELKTINKKSSLAKTNTSEENTDEENTDDENTDEENTDEEDDDIDNFANGFDKSKQKPSKNENEIENMVNTTFEKYEKPKKSKKPTNEEIYRFNDNDDDNDEENENYVANRNEPKISDLNNGNKLGMTHSNPSQFQMLGKEFEVELAKQILQILKKSRYDNYNEWIRVGWALHGVSPTLLPDYILFSKKSKKFVRGECEKIWQSASDFGGQQLGIGSLQWWAREDNLEEYLQILRRCMNPLINEAKSGTHDDIANVMKEMYKHMYKCVSIQKNIWYEFQGSAWVLLDSAYTLKERIPSEVVKEFFVLHSSHIASAGGTLAVDQDEHIKQSGKIQKLYDKLKNVPFQKQVIEACTAKFYDKKFEETLNTNPMLLGFKNGVYDLERMCFRKGTPDDLISMTTGYDYKMYSYDSPEIKKVEKYFAQVQRQEDVRTYVLRLIASFLDGRVKDQKFILWTGHGCHAKNEEILMYDKTTKKIQDIKIRDNVMGPDKRPRRVIATYTGIAHMYTVNVEDVKKTRFRITPNHRLALRCHFKPTITKSYDDIYNVDIYWVNYHELTNDGPVKIEEKFYDIETATKFIEELESKEEYIEYGRILPLKIHDYSQIKSDISKYYKLCLFENNDLNLDANFTIEFDDTENEYFGIELDGDRKYVMANGYVTYNSNGKSTTISLIHDTLGDYSGTLASQVVTRKRGGAGQATPDLADKMGKRFLAIQEPDPEDQIYVGQMKELSAGNDKISARALYGNPFYYKPQFKMVLCCNKLPTIPSNDGGTWRRLRVTPWESQFVDLNYKDPLEPHQFYKDPKLEDDMKKWPQPFMWLLINKYYPDYIKNGLAEPEKVLQFTNKYKKDSDVYLEFLSQWTEDPGDPDYEEPVSILYKMFKLWYKEAYSSSVAPQKEFVSYLENKFVIEKGKVKGIKLKIGD